MKRTTGGHLPKMRKQGLIIDELPDEVLVYDLDRHKAHCLNRSAALVWRRCDGKTPPAEIARRVQLELDRPFNEDLVWLALGQLNKINLLAESIVPPPPLTGISRRQMVQALGIAAAIAAPVVTSIVSPTAVQASTCIPSGGTCTTSVQCCSKDCKTNGKCR